MSRWACIACVAIGCGQPAPAQTPRTPPPSTATADAAVEPRPALADDLPRLALRARQMYLDWKTALGDGSSDCPTATARMNEVADKNADVIAASNQVMKDGHEKVKAFRAEIDKYEAEMQPVARAIAESPIMERCASDAAFGKAVERLHGDR